MSVIRKLPREKWQAQISRGNLLVMSAVTVAEDGSEYAYYTAFPLSPCSTDNPISIEEIDGVELRVK